ncbi:MAG: hypothetical protein HYZ72_15705 [Deltaproteobacteria bacterium]|nr:hypothetical protein [Deltaproteobacteria bacterium]
MKRTVTLTAAALMLAGMTSLSLAHENMTEGKSTPAVQGQPAASTAPVAAKPGVNAAQDKQPAVVSGKSEVQPSKEQPAAPQKVVQGRNTTAEKTVTEKKETSTVTPAATPESKEKKAEQKPQETHTGTNPTK